ncbi:RDD family protein [Rhodococcus sp. T7]|uniref:RDD family protein n=1 Tax=Rhodococcus sp. T7 TaxID=627444 RepID=UPI0013582BD6|nr:RDD family protein [Rhodococcus sp. T7]KAF0965406.1 hypothetical protein MLGJGCBP_01453 [Rhodococcus sp. T7]
MTPVTQASAANRFLAKLIDLVLVTVIFSLVSAAATAVFLDMVHWNLYRILTALLGITIAIASISYFVLSDHLVGYTLGKRILGLRVVSVTGNGRPTLTQSVTRNAFLIPMYLGSLVSSLALFASTGSTSIGTAFTGLAAGGAASLLGSTATIGAGIYLLVTISSSPEGRGFHDLKSETVVTAKSPITSTAPTP